MPQTNISFGLAERDRQTLRDVFKKYPEVQHVCLFGSRAKGTYHAGSDIDLAVMDANVPARTLTAIKEELSDSDLPYHVDVVGFAELHHQELREHIRRVGVAVYKINETNEL